MTATVQIPTACAPSKAQRSKYSAPTLTLLCLQRTAGGIGSANDGNISASNPP